MADVLFPILQDEQIRAIPWEVLAPHERQAQRNHSQTLRRLAERGGLSPAEAVAVLDGLDWGAIDKRKTKAFWRARLMGLVHRFEHDKMEPKP